MKISGFKMIDREGMKIDEQVIDKEHRVYRVNVAGYVDQSNVHLLQNIIDEYLKNDQYKLIFDLKDLTYMSSAGWGVLIGEIKRFRENGGDIKLINMGPEVYEIYQMLEFYHIIAEYPSLEEALGSFNINQEFKIIADSSNNRFVLSNPPDQKTDEEQDEGISEEYETDSRENSNRSENREDDLIEKDIEFEIDSSAQELERFEDKTSHAGYVEFNPQSTDRKIDIKMLPVSEKVRKIVGQYPQFGIFKIKKILQHPQYGSVKVGFFKLRALLKELDLDTKEKRFRFYRSM